MPLFPDDQVMTGYSDVSPAEVLAKGANVLFEKPFHHKRVKIKSCRLIG